jgi:hypothetical protein
LDHRDRGRTVRDRTHLEAAGFQSELEHLADGAFVVDDEEPWGRPYIVSLVCRLMYHMRSVGGVSENS